MPLGGIHEAQLTVQRNVGEPMNLHLIQSTGKQIQNGLRSSAVSLDVCIQQGHTTAIAQEATPNTPVWLQKLFVGRSRSCL
jgi:hypothetical protein